MTTIRAIYNEGYRFLVIELNMDPLIRHTPSICKGSPESQQPTGSQIIRICMGIYRKIDKTVKMYIKSYY